VSLSNIALQFVQDGQDEVLSQTVHVNIAPMSNVDTFPAMRRPSLSQTADTDPRRVASEANMSSAPLRRGHSFPPSCYRLLTLSQADHSSVPSLSSRHPLSWLRRGKRRWSRCSPLLHSEWRKKPSPK
jgi:hypothetical protein